MIVDFERVNATIFKLKGLAPIEKVFSRNRLTKLSAGKMPQWEKQVELTGLESMAYVVLAYMWGAAAGGFAVFACLLVILQRKSSSLSGPEIALFGLTAALLLFATFRFAQGIRVGKQYRNSKGLN